MSTSRTETPDGPSATNGDGHIITSADALLVAWQKRDRQYAARPQGLSASEVQLIRRQREYEAGFVEPRRRGPLFVKARHWAAPRLGEWA